MNDLISRQAAIDALYSVDEYNSRSVKAIKQLPPIQPKRGKWIIYTVSPFDGEDVKCSECGQRGCAPYWDFCPNCGSRNEVTE